MATYNLIKREDDFYVEGLRDGGTYYPADTLLMVVYLSGDCDTVQEPGQLMHHALYDLYQTCEQLKDGDVFMLDGKPAYACKGVHVIELWRQS